MFQHSLSDIFYHFDFQISFDDLLFRSVIIIIEGPHLLTQVIFLPLIVAPQMSSLKETKSSDLLLIESLFSSTNSLFIDWWKINKSWLLKISSSSSQIRIFSTKKNNLNILQPRQSWPSSLSHSQLKLLRQIHLKKVKTKDKPRWGKLNTPRFVKTWSLQAKLKS